MFQQETERLNTTEVILPTETAQTPAMPAVVPKSPLDWPVEMFTQALDRREINRKALLKWIGDNLQAGVDYGQIHVVGRDKCQYARNGNAQDCPNKRHWSKPSLWKPGAEKICGMLGLIPRFPNLSEYEKAVLRGEAIKMVILKCELHTGNGFVAAEGTGARTVDKQDRGDINKSLKMAEKSAHIDATLRVAGLSELFTQDIEDMFTNKDRGQSENHAPAPNSRPEPVHRETRSSRHTQREEMPPGGDNGQGYTNGQRVTAKQHRYILNLCAEREISKQDINRYCLKVYGVKVDYLNRAEASSLIEHLINH